MGLLSGEQFPCSTQIVRLQGFERLRHLRCVEALTGEAFLGLGSGQSLVCQAMLLSWHSRMLLWPSTMGAAARLVVAYGVQEVLNLDVRR